MELQLVNTAIATVVTGRTVIVACPSANKAKKIENFTGTTWGELRQVPEVAELFIGNLDPVLNPGNVTLGREDSALPAGDFRVFLVPSKNEAGMNETDAYKVAQDVSGYIQRAAKVASVEDAKDLKAALKQQIEAFFNVTVDEPITEQPLDEETANNPELMSVLEEAKSLSH